MILRVTSRITRLGLVPALVVAALAGLALVLPVGPTHPRAVATPGARAAALGAHNDTSTPFNLVSIPALTRHEYDGRALRLTRVITRTISFTRYAVSYRSGDLKITGVMDVPARRGRFPLVVLAHGWTDPARYRSGGMIERERVRLAQSGFVALQIDYRNHGGSTRETTEVVAEPLGYPEDLVNAVRAVRRARLPFVDAGRVGLFGRSMGGGVVINALAARPRLAKAAVLYSPVSSSAVETYRRWVRPNPELRAKVEAAYGTPTTRPDVWSRASARTYLGRVDVPMQVHHGKRDDVCPVRWSRATVKALKTGGNRRVTMHGYVGQDHRFTGQSWRRFMTRSIAFLRAELT
jgi:dipeptidyl aminopeptidase/acylaminoacyl peptidase